MKRYFYVGIVIIVALAVAIVGYGAWLNYNDENQIARSMEARAFQLTGSRAAYRRLSPSFVMSTLRLYSESMTDAVSLIDGRVSGVYVAKNSPVRAGEVIMTLTNEQIPLQIRQAESNVQRAEAAYSQSTSNVQRAEAGLAQATNAFHRQQRLMARNATSQEKLEAAEAEYLAAQESVRAAEAERTSARAAIDVAAAELAQYQVQQSRQDVIAPIDGSVLLIYHREGSYVQGGTPLALVGNFDRLRFTLTLDESDSRKIHGNQTARLVFRNNSIEKPYGTEYSAGNLGNNEAFTAMLIEINPSLETPAAMRQSVWEIDNRSHILEPLTYNNVTMQLSEALRCLTVPLSAMVDSAREQVFVVKSDGTLELRKIKTGIDDGEFIEVISGLRENDAVIVDGFEGLSDGMHVEVTFEGGGADVG